MLYKKYESIDYVHGYHNKENWLKTYYYFLQPMTNMAMWPQSSNPSIAPSIIKPMPGRPPKARRKEANETRKSRKLSKTGMQMTWGNCGGKNHNKRSCHKNATRNTAASTTTRVVGISTAVSQITAAAGSSTVASTTGQVAGPSTATRPRGRPRKESVVPETPPKPRGRPRKKTSAPKAPPRPRGRPRKELTVPATPRSRGRSRKEPEVAATPTSSAFAGTRRKASSPALAVVPRRRETEGPSTYHNKRSKTVGMGMFVAKNGYTSLNESVIGCLQYHWYAN